jgi:hypothetical protein
MAPVSERCLEEKTMSFLQALKEQRWDDHRYYHHSRVNQSLHLFSALSFLTAYVFLFINPVVSVFLGWLVAMVLRQTGHFFFEPKGYDDVNAATHAHKESIKVGYNLQRKIVLLSIWAACPLVLLMQPSLFGLLTPHDSAYGFVYNLSILWLAVAGGGLLARTLQLFFIRDVQTGLVWFAKILTDPFHDVKLYYKSPYYLYKGEWIDPMYDVQMRAAAESKQ